MPRWECEEPPDTLPTNHAHRLAETVGYLVIEVNITPLEIHICEATNLSGMNLYESVDSVNSQVVYACWSDLSRHNRDSHTLR